MSETEEKKQLRLVLEQQCRAIGKELAESCPARTGFAFFLFDFGDGGNLAYISNGKRADIIKTVEEWLRRVKVAS